MAAVSDAQSAYSRPASAATIRGLGCLSAERGPSFPSLHAAVAGAAAAVFSDLFPTEARGLIGAEEVAGSSRLWAGASYRSDVEAGLAMGREIGRRAVAREPGTVTPAGLWVEIAREAIARDSVRRAPGGANSGGSERGPGRCVHTLLGRQVHLLDGAACHRRPEARRALPDADVPVIHLWTLNGFRGSGDGPGRLLSRPMPMRSPPWRWRPRTPGCGLGLTSPSITTWARSAVEWSGASSSPRLAAAGGLHHDLSDSPPSTSFPALSRKGFAVNLGRRGSGRAG